jgi:hypothetical protein
LTISVYVVPLPSFWLPKLEWPVAWNVRSGNGGTCQRCRSASKLPVRVRIIGHDRFTPRQAFASWIGCVDAWRIIPYADPGLPASWLPADWPGNLSVRLFAELRERLEDLSGRYVHQVTASPALRLEPGSGETP